jgi:heat shock protein HslJ
MKKQIIIISAFLLLAIGCQAPKETIKTEQIIVTEKNSKTVEDNNILEKYWKLKILAGVAVKMTANQTKEAYFILKLNENRVTGFGGCNSFFGSYELIKKGNRIKFSHLGSTEMYCPNVNESEFMNVFEITDNYSIKDDVLSLNIGKRAPLAVFEAVYF